MRVTNLFDEMEKRGIIDKTTRRMVEKSETANEEIASSMNTAQEGVSLEISDESKQKWMDLLNMQMQMENIRKQNENADEMVEDVLKIMEIFRRIANGDIVPPQDEQKLLEYSSEMYHAAKSAAMLAENEDPEEYESVDKYDEDDKEVKKSKDRSGENVLSESVPKYEGNGEGICE